MSWIKNHAIRVLACSACLVMLACGPLLAADYILSKGQTVYVPVYSNIYSSPKAVPNNLANILSIRNTDLSPRAIDVTVVDYYDTKGKLVKKHYTKALTLAPLESTAHIHPGKEKRGRLRRKLHRQVGRPRRG